MGDGEVFVGGNDVEGGVRGGGADPFDGAAGKGFGLGVEGGVDFGAEEGQICGKARAQGGGIFADAAGEEEGVGAAEEGDVAAAVVEEAVAEEVDGELGLGGVGGEEGGHVAREA